MLRSWSATPLGWTPLFLTLSTTTLELHINLHYTSLSIKENLNPKSQAAHREKGQASTQATQDTHYYVPTIYTVFHENKLL